MKEFMGPLWRETRIQLTIVTLQVWMRYQGGTEEKQSSEGTA